MPYLGRTSFLHISGIKRVKLIDGVNALSRAHFISTLCVHIRLQVMTCVNALSRAHFISTSMANNYGCYMTLCQCPISGALHFYYAGKGHRDQGNVGCVNALSRAHFISTGQLSKAGAATSSVSMPYLGRTSFLRARKMQGTDFRVVSMPYLGRTSFLL